MSLTINHTQNAAQATVSLAGRLDTNTAPELENTLRALLPTCSDLTLDFADLAYVSSAGLRVLLVAQKEMNRKAGQLTLTHVNEDVMEVLDMTGFTDILTIA